MSGTDRIFDRDERVARRVPARGGARGEIDGYRRGGSRIVDRIAAAAAVEGVGTRAAGQPVVARAARQDVGARIADQHVVERGAEDVLEIGDDVALRVAAAGRPRCEVDVHRLGRG